LYYLFKEVILENNSIKKVAVKAFTLSPKKIAIVAHVFYVDIWDEINQYLKNINIPYDIFVTVPPSIHDEDLKSILTSNPHVRLYMTENRGRDVLPFLQIMSIIPENNYDYICKIHTKKTGDSPLGNVWRKLLYFDLIGSNETVEKTISMFESDDSIGIITGKNVILDSQRYAYGNDTKIDLLAEKTDILYNENYLFPAGTMFWIRTSLLVPLVEVFKNNALEFEEEKGQKDDTLAHAVERFFGIMCQSNNQTISPSPASYAQLQEETIDQLSDLILQQQYAGVDMFLKQKHVIAEKDQWIKEQDQYIKKLEALAESMRIKNRIKRLFPSNVKSKFKKVIDLLKVIKNNPQILKKAFYYLIRGDIAYLWTKTKEKSAKNITQSAKLVEIQPSRYLKKFNAKEYVIEDITIDIIIPVYNGFEFLEKLFDSIENNTSTPYRLIVIDDCSPDERVKPYLKQRLQKHENAVFIDHTDNKGFLKSVNEAYAHTSNHFVLLNTDTEVPSYWLERLMYPILHMDKVASTTPFTNSGEIASFPNFVADNPIFDHMDVDALDDAFKEVNPTDFYEAVPTGVGFCMGVNYTLAKSIGMFAEDTFGKGYGEENDWCQRAIKEGYKNLIVPNLFVYHKHGGSFSVEEKEKLLKENASKLLARHPNYGKDVHTYIQKDPHATLRQFLVLKAVDKKRGTHVIFDHDLGGGANIYANELVESNTQKRLSTLLIRYDFYTNTFKLFHHYKKYTNAFKIASLDELKVLLTSLDVKALFLNSLVSFKNSVETLQWLSAFIDEQKVKVTIPIHDYYAICPSYTLLNDEGQYCGVPSLDKCKTCMKHNTQEWRNFYTDTVDMEVWRNEWHTLLEKSQDILCFSQASKDILLKAYPTIDTEHIQVIPHTVKSLAPIETVDKVGTTRTIGILGAINYAKGSEVIKHLVQKIEREDLDINIVLIGEMSDNLKSTHFHATGRYNRDDLPQIVKDEKIDTFIIPSIWPETFSYTTQEIMMMQMPLMVFNLGAPAERVAHYEKGYVLDDMSVESILNMLTKIQD